VFDLKVKLARPKRFELLTPRFVVWCSRVPAQSRRLVGLLNRLGLLSCHVTVPGHTSRGGSLLLGSPQHQGAGQARQASDCNEEAHGDSGPLCLAFSLALSQRKPQMVRISSSVNLHIALAI